METNHQLNSNEVDIKLEKVEEEIRKDYLNVCRNIIGGNFKSTCERMYNFQACSH